MLKLILRFTNQGRHVKNLDGRTSDLVIRVEMALNDLPYILLMAEILHQLIGSLSHYL